MNLLLQRSAATVSVERVEQEDTVILFAGGTKEVLEVNTSDLFFVENKSEVVVLDTSDQVVENKSKSGRICNSVQIRPLQVVY